METPNRGINTSMTLLGNFVRTSGQGKEKSVEEREKVMRSFLMKTRRRIKISLHAQPLEPIPDLTSRIAQASFPKGTLAMQLRDALGAISQDADFADLFPR